MSTDKTYLVKVVGIGGPMAEFHQRQYQVKSSTPGKATDIAVDYYVSVYSKQDYAFSSAEVYESDDKITVIE